MPETNPDYVTHPDLGPQATLTIIMVVAMVGIVVVTLVGILAGPETATDPHPEPAPSPSPSSTWSPECTAEDLDDGACYTWDDIRDLEWHTQSPTPIQ